MLKRKKYVYECEDYKIKNPNEEEIQEIQKVLSNYTNNNKEIDYDNAKLNHYLFKELIISDNIDYQFDKYSLSNFIELMDNPTKEFKDMVYYVGDIISDITIEFYRAYRLEIKQAEAKFLEAQTIREMVMLNEQEEDIKIKKKQLEHEKKVNSNKKDIEVKKLNKLQIFLYKHGWIK